MLTVVHDAFRVFFFFRILFFSTGFATVVPVPVMPAAESSTADNTPILVLRI